MNSRWFFLACLLGGRFFFDPVPVGAQSLTLTAPNQSGLSWSGAENIAWTAGTSGWTPGDTLTIELSDNGGTSYDHLLATNIPYDLGDFRFYSSLFANGSSYRVRVSWTAGGGGSVESGYNFTIGNSVIGTAYFVNDADTVGDVYCTAAGDNSNNGLSPSSPKWNLQSIVDGYTLGPGDVVYVDTGTWNLPDRVYITSYDHGSSSTALYFAGSPNGTIFGGANLPSNRSCLHLHGSYYLELAEFTAQSSPVHGIRLEANPACELYAVTATENTENGIYLQNSSQVKLRNCTVIANAVGVHVSGSNDIDITGCLLKNNVANGVYVYQGENFFISHNAIVDTVGTNLRLLNPRYVVVCENTFSGGSGIYLGEYTYAVRIFNNIIQPSGSDSYAYTFYSQSCELLDYVTDFNLINPIGGAIAGKWNRLEIFSDFRAWVLGSGQDGHSISGDPLFFDAGENDFHLQSTEGRFSEGQWYEDSESSPCLNAGAVCFASATLSASVPADTDVLPLSGTSGFENGPEWVETEGDFSYYTGIAGNTLVGCSGSAFAHAAGALVVQPVGADFSQETAPNGYRANVGAYGNTPEASKSSRRSLFIDSPLGQPLTSEKWSQTHDVSWRPLGDGWTGTDTLSLSYSTDSVTWTVLTAGIAYDSFPYAWDTASSPDSATGRVRIDHTAGSSPRAAEAKSGPLVTDNTPPTNVGCSNPSEGEIGVSRLITLIALECSDSPAGLNATPYYFRADTVPSFDSGDLLTSGWISNNLWTVNLNSNSTYYWQVRGRDAANPNNVSEFQGDSGVPGSYHYFQTQGIYHALTVEESEAAAVTDGLRWILQNRDLGQGDIVYVSPGNYTVSEPIVFPPADEGAENSPVRITGLNGEVLLDGDGIALNCLKITGNWFQVENFSFTGATGSGIQIEGDHVTLQGGRSFSNGGDGIEVMGDYALIKNMLVHDNFLSGIHLSASFSSTLENNTCTDNGLHEITLGDDGLDGSSNAVLRSNIAWAQGTGNRMAIFVETESQTGFDSDYNNFFTTSPAKLGYWNDLTQATFSAWTGACGEDGSSVSADPLFAGSGDYHLQSTSGSYHGGSWLPDGNDSPGLDRGDPFASCGLETSPGGGRINQGAYGNTTGASRSPGKSGRNFYVNDASIEYDYFCSTAGLPWPTHDGLSAGSPLNSVEDVFSHYTIGAGDSIFIDTGLYQLASPVTITNPGAADNRVTLTGSPEGTVLNSAGVADYSVSLSSASYVSLQNLTLINSASHGLNVSNSDNFIIADSTVMASGAYGLVASNSDRPLISNTSFKLNKGPGIYLFRCYDSPSIRNCILENNIGFGIYLYECQYSELASNSVTNNSDHGIYLYRTSGGNSLVNNIVHSNGSASSAVYCYQSAGEFIDNTVDGYYGLRIVNISNGVITGNQCSGTIGLRIEQAADCLIANNILNGCSSTGLDIRYTFDSSLKNNTFYGNLIGAYIHSDCQGNTLTNNIFHSSGSGNMGLYFKSPSEGSQSCDFNLYYITGGASVGYWSGLRGTFEEWQQGTRQDGHGVADDPRFADPSTGDFHLPSTAGRYSNGKWIGDAVNSPALNKGNPSDDYASELAPNGDRVNIGAFGNTPQASRASLKTLSLSSPRGKPWGSEKWSRSHEVEWEAHGTGWSPSDTVDLEYTINGVDFFEITSGFPYISGVYSSWNTLSAAGNNSNYRVAISSPGGPAFYAEDLSGFFIVDNTPPTGVGCQLPADGSPREPLSTTLTAQNAGDGPAGLNSQPYCFQIDTSPLFDSPALQNSGWRSLPTWHAALQPNTTYYWRVNARDAAVPVNERGFCGNTDEVGTFWSFRTLGLYHALDIESETVGLRWILDNVELNPGDIVYVDAGNYVLSNPLEFSSADEGSDEAPVLIAGYGGEVVLDAGGVQDHCLIISGDYYQVENFNFTNALSSGVLISGDRDLLQYGASYSNGGDGIEGTGDYITIKNMRVYDNALAGIHLDTSHHSRVESNTCARNGTKEVFLEDNVPPAPYHREGSTYCTLLDNIIWASASGTVALFADEESQVGFASDYNDVYATDGGAAGFWNSATLATFSEWTESSFQDQSSVSVDPLFAPGSDDFHLSSAGGRWDGSSWALDTQTSPGVDRGDSLSIYSLESAPNGGRINLGAYGNTVQASRSPSAAGRNFYVNDSDTEWDYYCSTAGLPWPAHDGLTPAAPLDSISTVFANYTMLPGDTIYVDTGLYTVNSIITVPASGTEEEPFTITGSPHTSILDIEGHISICLYVNAKNFVNLNRLWIFNTSENAVYIAGSSNCSVSDSVIRGSGTNGIYGSSSTLFLNNNSLSYNFGSGIYLTGGTGSRVVHNSSKYNDLYGYYLYNQVDADFSDNLAAENADVGSYLKNLYGSNRIENNTFNSNQNQGLYASVVSGSFCDNISTGNTYGLYLTQCHYAVVARNTVFSNINTGLYVNGSYEAAITRNVSYKNGGYGISVAGSSPNGRIINNTCYQNAGELSLSNGATKNIVANNILWADQASGYAIYMGSTAISPYSNYNILYATNGANIGYWSGTRSTFDQWKAASGQDGASLNLNPNFVAPAAGDFHLQSPLGSYHGGLWTADTNASPGLNLGQIYTADSYLAQPADSSSTFLELTDATNFLNQTDTADVRGDFISYTGKSGDTLVGLSGVNEAYPTGTRVFQPAGSDYTLEPAPNGGRINIGAYGGTLQATLADTKTLAMVEPLGGEEWNGSRTIRWLAVGEEWAPGDILIVEYTTDGTSFFTISTETYPTQLYADWNTLSAAGDGSTYQISVREPAGLRAGSGTFTIDNTPPDNVGCYLPEDGESGLPPYVPLRALRADDALVGLHDTPYYFQVAETSAFTAPGLIDSGWVSNSMWVPNLGPGTTYYWRVKARDKISNESPFCGFAADTDGYGVLRVSNEYRATDIESATTGLRWILANRDFEPGDVVFVNAGTYTISAPLTVGSTVSGSGYYPVKIVGSGTGVILDGGNSTANCLILEGNDLELDNISFTRATDSGLSIAGDNNTVRSGRSWNNGGDGVRISGNADTLVNFVLDGNGRAGASLNGGEGNRVVNVTSHDNVLGEIICQNSPYSYLRNNILWASLTDAHGIYVDVPSQTGFESDYNDLLGPSPAYLGYWGGNIPDLASWQATASQDADSISLDPLFAPGASDYHLQSPEGRWVGWASWTDGDTQTSPGIDTGDPDFPYAFESSPKGGRINLGAYGNTYQASRSPGAPGNNYWVNDTSTENDVYTTTTGRNNYSGALPSRPKQTLQNLIDLVDLEPGDTVFIDTGNYPLTATIEIGLPDSGSSAGSVFLTGSPHRSLFSGDSVTETDLYLNQTQYLETEALTVTSALAYGLRLENAQNVVLHGSSFSWNGLGGTPESPTHGAGVFDDGSTVLSITENTATGNVSSGISCDNTRTLTVTENLVGKNYGIVGFNHSGIQIQNCETGSIRKNVVFRNQYGLSISRSDLEEVSENIVYSHDLIGATFSSSSSVFSRNLVYGNLEGGAVFSSGTVDILDNTFYKNSAYEIYLDSPGCVVKNNISWAEETNDYCIFASRTNGHYSDFNNLYATGGAWIGRWGTNQSTLAQWQIASRQDQHSLSADPLFVDPAGADGIVGGNHGADDDFHPRSTEGSYHFGSWTNDTGDSPALNSGSPYDDYDLETEPNGARINQGAYGDTVEASRSSLDTIFLVTPYGGDHGREVWSGEHPLAWLPVGPGWGGGDTVSLEYTPDGSAYFLIAGGLAWNALTYPAWDTSALADGATYQVRASDDADPGAVNSSSGRFTVDNTAPVNVGCLQPPDNSQGLDTAVSLTGLTATDALAGLNSTPYYFRIDKDPSFSSPDLQNSGWINSPVWDLTGLDTRTWYYWQVKARDAADLPNESAFGADTDVPGSWWAFKTAAVFHVVDTQQLRDVFDTEILEPGDRIYLDAGGDFSNVTAPITAWGTFTGSADLPIHIEGENGRPVISGDGVVSTLLEIQGAYFSIEGIDFTGSGGAGLLLSGDHNTVNGCGAYENGVSGFETGGSSNRIQNTFTYLNGNYGIFLNHAVSSVVYNNSGYDNGTYCVMAASSTDSTLYNNNFWARGGGESCIGVGASSQPTTVTDWNNFFATDGAAVGYWNGSCSTLGDWQSACSQDANSLSQDPRFYKIAWWGNREYIYDLHLISNWFYYSPAIDRGLSGGTVPLLDYDDEGRWDDPLVPNAGGGPFGYYDVGADEYVDADLDYLPDYWENLYFGHTGEGYHVDSDSDGLTNIEEYYYYTNPANPDTDFDTFSDGPETVYGTNPLDPDTDYDGLLDGAEIYQYTNRPYSTITCDPLDPDTDDDGFHANFNDGTEVYYWDNESWASWSDDIDYGGGDGLVNLLDPDSDGDGCPDGWEVYYALDPADYGQFDLNNGGVGDPDGDRLSNYEEYYFGTDPTNPGDPLTMYVDLNASGAGNGTSWADAWNAIAPAAAWADATDIPVRILVAPGTYYENQIELTRSGIALLGDNPGLPPILDGGGAGRGFDITGGGICRLGAFEIRNCVYSQHGGAIRVSSSSPYLTGLVIHDNATTGVSRGGAIYILGTDSAPLVSGCTIVKNSGYGGYGGIYISEGNPRIYNCILWDNGADIGPATLSPSQLLSILFGCNIENGDIEGFNGNISSEPGFRHYYSNHLHLASFYGETNPCINSGNSWKAMLLDFEGEGRWNYLSMPETGAGIEGYYYCDIGADEYLDVDYNTLPDWWEVRWFSATGQDPDLDVEPDGLTNYQEYYYLTDPTNPDTDFDGLTDSDEVTYWDAIHDVDWPDNSNNPHRWDSDDNGDFLVDILDWDSDWDNLSDGAEAYYYGTDPAALDTDGDGIEDGDEVDFWNDAHNGAFPDGAVTDWSYDWDGDGIPNLLDPDSDNDAIPDGWEWGNLFDPADDGYYYLVNGSAGDPDDDRVYNLVEYLFGTDPRDPASPPVVIVDDDGTVGVDCDYNTIRAALADNVGPLSILVRAGFYAETSIAMKQNIALLGEYAADTVIDASGGRGVIFSGISAALLDGFTITNAEIEGNAGAAILCLNSSPYISNCVIAGNTASGSGGVGAALYAGNGSAPRVVGCTIADNAGEGGYGGVYLDSADSDSLLSNNILWGNGDDLFGAQTDMVRNCDIEDGDYDGVNGNVSLDPLFTDPATGNYHIHWTSPMICAGAYRYAGGYDMDGWTRPQTACLGTIVPGPPVYKIPQESFNIGAHEAQALPSPTPSPTATATPTMTPTPSTTPSPTPSLTPSVTPTPTPMTPPPSVPPVPTPATPTPTPEGYKTPPPSPTPEFPTPTPGPTPIDFWYRDRIREGYLILHTPQTYYSISWASDTWREIYDKPDNTWYIAQWEKDGDVWWSQWTYHETATQYLDALWTTPTPIPPSPITPAPTPYMGTATPTVYGKKTPTPPLWPTPTPEPPDVPDFRYRDQRWNSYLFLHTPDTYYAIGWSSDTWQDTSDMPNNTWYIAQWSYGNQPYETWWSEWTYHGLRTQYLEPNWPATPTPTPTMTPSPTITPSVTPTPSFAYWFLAAGGTKINGYDFDEYVSVTNPTGGDAPIEITAVDELGPIVRRNAVVPAESRFTFDLPTLVAGTRGENNPSVSLLIYDQTDRIILVDRSMYWNAGGIEWGGGHNSIGSHAAAATWSLPEGATHAFDEYIHIVNPGKVGDLTGFSSNVRVTFVNQYGDSWTRYKEMPPETNWTIYVNDVVGIQPHVSTLVESLNGVGVSADRTMYFDGIGYNGNNVKWVGGHCSIGTNERSTNWFVSEGATHAFDEYILITNPSQVQDADLRVTLLDRFGILKEFDHVVPPHTRYTVYVNKEVGWSEPHISAIVDSRPRVAPAPSPHPATYITVERAMYWKPFDSASWGAAHNTIGALYTSPVWYLPEGATQGFDEYVLVANPDPDRTSEVKVTFYFENETPYEYYETIEPLSRKTIYVNKIISSPAISTKVEALPGYPDIIAERSMYWHSYNPWVPWVAGHATIGIPKRSQD